METETLTDSEREILREAQEHELMVDMRDSHLADVRRANQKLGEALREIYANNGEDESISKICNEAFQWIDI